MLDYLKILFVFFTLNLGLEAEPASNIYVEIKKNIKIKSALSNQVNEYLLKYFLDSPILNNIIEKNCDLYSANYNDVRLFAVICSKKIVYVAAKSLKEKAFNEPENWHFLKEFIAVDFSKYYTDNQIGGFVYYLEDNSRVDWSELNNNRCIKSDSISTDPRTIQYGEDEGWQNPSFVCISPPLINLWINKLNQITGNLPKKTNRIVPTVYIGYYETENINLDIDHTNPIPLKYVEIYDYINSTVLLKILKFDKETLSLKDENLFSQPFVDIYHANLPWSKIGNNQLHNGWDKREKGFHKLLKRKPNGEWDFSDQQRPISQ